MTRKRITSLFVGLGIAVGIISLILLFHLFITFSLGGGETIQQIEGQRIFLLILTLGAFGISLGRGIFLYKSGRKEKAVGLNIPFIITLTLVLLYNISSYSYPVKFEQNLWNKNERKPFRIAATLAKNNSLIDKTWSEVKEMLGDGKEEYGGAKAERGSMIYSVENSWSLVVYFRNGIAKEVELRKPMMMTLENNTSPLDNKKKHG